MAQNFPNSPTNGDTTVINGITYTYVSASSKWRATQVGGSGAGSGGSGTTTYATIAELPLTGNAAGDQAFVSGNNRLYIWNGTGWYNIALINTAPTITGGGAGSYDLAIDGTPTVITLTAADPEEVPITWTYSVTSGSLTNGGGVTATVSQADNVFTITPTTTEAYAGTFGLTFTASDGVNIATDVNSFTLNFITIVADSSYTTLLLQADAASTDNQTDASTNSFAITENDNVTSTAFTPYHPRGYSVYFDGSGDYLRDDTIADLMDHTDGNSDSFTIELWVYDETPGETNAIIGSNSTATGANDFNLLNNGVEWLSSIQMTFSLTANTWHHLVVEYDRSSGNYLSCWLDGTRVNRVSVSGAMSFANNHFAFGTEADAGNFSTLGNYFQGYMHDVKISKEALYGDVATISIPTEPTSPETSNVFSGFTDSYIPNDFTVGGDPKTELFGSYDYSPPYSKSLHGGSVYFDGSNDYMTVGSAADWKFLSDGSTDCTIEGWIYLPDISSGRMEILSTNTNTITNGYGVTLGANMFSAGDLAIQYANGIDGTSGQFLTNSGPGFFEANTWTHFAVVLDVSATEVKLYKNGSLFTTGTKSYTFGNSNPYDALNIGRYVGAVSTGGYFQGYMSDLRITSSTVYTAEFTPPTEPLTAITNTQLLTCTNKHEVWDASGGNLLTLVGDTTASTTQTKYSNSIYFDDSGDYITATVDPPLAGDFTCEAWVRFDSISAGNQIICSFGTFTPALFYRSASNDISIYHGTAFYQSGFNPSANTWYHIAMAREGTSIRVFIDGTQYGTTQTYSTSITSTNLRIGYDGNDYFGGYIEDFRYTKGLARYTTNFTPPTGSLEG